MKFIAVFGSISLLSTVAIIAWISAKHTEKLTPGMSEDRVHQKVDRINKSLDKIDEQYEKRNQELLNQ